MRADYGWAGVSFKRETSKNNREIDIERWTLNFLLEFDRLDFCVRHGKAAERAPLIPEAAGSTDRQQTDLDGERMWTPPG